MTPRIYTAEEIAAQRALDYESREEHWRRIEADAGGGERGKAIADAFRKLYTLYTPELAKWYANLYDPGVGGYYSTNSGRDYDYFAPDAECTMQSLRFIEGSGLISEVGALKEVIPEEMQKKLIYFAKSRQNENGFFYHPHWNFDDVHYNLSRRGRDLGWATQILNAFGSAPTYDTPNGYRGDGIDADGNPVKLPSQKESRAKETEARPAAATHASYLENKETFIEYLNGIDLRSNSYHFGNIFNSTIGQIRARAKALLDDGAGYDLREILLDWFDSLIDPSTGYWGAKVNMAGSNGFFKIIPIYNQCGRLYPYAEKATESVLLSIMGDEIDANNCCSLYNLWSSVSFIKSNVAKFAPDELKAKLLAKVDDVLRDRGADAILNTYEKVKPYQKGVAFSHHYHGNGGCQQGLFTGLTTVFCEDEGNVDATGICSTGLTRGMFEAFGFNRVPMLGKADWMEYSNILNTAKPVVKKYRQEPYISFKDPSNVKFIIPLGNTARAISNGALEVDLLADGQGFDIERTSRICKGEYVLFETELSLSDITSDGVLRIGPSRGKNPSKYQVYADLKVEGEDITVSCERWTEGFKRTVKLTDPLKIRIEYYLDPRPRKDKKEMKCTAERVYINGELIGSAVNDDGTDPLFPTGLGLNVLGFLTVSAEEGLRAKLRMTDVIYSHPRF